ncbi:MAG: benzoate-CoA ligase family protein [Streptosporangiales bacterium]|nr:benzoate-CoA ligase family protein [Streptosporangiales bacterium]
MEKDVFNASTYLVDRRVEAGEGDRVALAGPRGTHTYAELLDLVGRVAAGLRELGVRPEERVMIFMVDGPRMLATILGAMRMGAVPVPVSTMLPADDLAELLADSRAHVLVASEEFAATVEGALSDGASPDVSDLVALVVDGEASVAAPAPVESYSFDQVLGTNPPRWEARTAPYPTGPDSPALWLYTSGTTGRPKAAMHRHANIRHVAETYGHQVLGIGPDDRCLSVAKLFFAYGIGNSCFFPLSVGASAVLDPNRPTPESVAERLVAERPTLFFGVPTFYAALLGSQIPDDAFGSVRRAVSAGEPLPARVYGRFLDRFGVEILDGIGSTEALHIFLSNRAGEVRPGTTGIAVPGYDLKILDDAGGPVERGKPGSLYVRGPSLALGYWCRTDTTRRVFQGEWLYTGDTYMEDEDGYYSCMGRTDDMIKAGGIWVAPSDVENRLIEHPEVRQAVVVAVPDADGIDKPVACVVVEPGARVGADELVAFCREKLASFKRPRQVLFVDSVPTTATGKVQRFALREWARAQATAGAATSPRVGEQLAGR